MKGEKHKGKSRRNLESGCIAVLVISFLLTNAFALLSTSNATTITLFYHVLEESTTFQIPGGKMIKSDSLVIEAYNEGPYLAAIRFKIDDIGGSLGCDRWKSEQCSGEGTISVGTTKTTSYCCFIIHILLLFYFLKPLQILLPPAFIQA